MVPLALSWQYLENVPVGFGISLSLRKEFVLAVQRGSRTRHGDQSKTEVGDMRSQSGTTMGTWGH